MGRAVSHGLVVRSEQTHLASGLDGHVGHGQTALDIQSVDDRAVEFQGLVQRAVHADGSDQAQDKVFAAHPAGKGSGIGDADGGRHLEPGFAQGHSSGDVGAAHAGGEGRHPAVGAGVTVRAHQDVAGPHQALFGQQGVFHAAFAAFVVAGDAHFGREGAGHHNLVG